jgi:bifunctional ADP-heptose synthase (sugar kinase/adenylyltransferase)
LEMVNKVVQVIDSDDTVCQTIREFRPSIFANGGDRTEKNIPELSVCEELNIKTVFGVGGGKKQSSSVLLSSWKENT